MKFSKKKKITVGLLGAAIYSIPLLTIDGAIDLFMQSEKDAGGLKGESTVPGYEGWIEIDSFQIGAGVAVSMSAGTTKDRTSSAPSFSELTVSKVVDSTSTGFFSSLTQGTHLPEMRLFIPSDSAPGRTVKIYLKDVLISSVSWSGSDGGGNIYESVSLNYTAIKVEHHMVDSKGVESKTGETLYNLATGKAEYPSP